VASAAATVPDIELVEVGETKAAEARTEDVLPWFPLTPSDEVTEVGTEDVDVKTEDVEGGTDDEEAGTSIEEVTYAGEVWTDNE